MPETDVQSPKPGRVPCLKCLKMFDSVDRCRNRICGACTRKNDEVRIPRVIAVNSLEGGAGLESDLEV